ncbi:hypothetical protein RB653_000802 [Dictyostelium firmibasis]|uniref:H-type lectin domain-containing protein n=1 Tax=Dictyostelium firmibasis TaxID=79012 RepID=A0AAN7U391_9MYCE
MIEKITKNNINHKDYPNIENNLFRKINFENVKTEINIGTLVCNEKNNSQAQRIIFDIPFTNTPKLAIYFKSIDQQTVSNVKFLSCNVTNSGFDFRFNYLNDKVNMNQFIIEYVAIYHQKINIQPTIKKLTNGQDEMFYVKNRFVSKM